MALCVVEENGLQYLVPERGKLPAEVVAFQGSGYARFLLLPSVAVNAHAGMSDQQLTEAKEGLLRHRDRLLAAWMPDAGEAFPQPRVAEGVRCHSAAYDAPSRSLRLVLTNGAQLSLPAQRDPVFGPADAASLAEVEVLCEGEFLRFPKLGRFERVPDLVLALLAYGPPFTPGRRAPAQPGPAPKAPPPGAPPKSLLGLILYREGYLSREQLQGLAQEQVRLQGAGHNLPIGQLAVNAGFLTPDQLRLALELQQLLSQAGPDTRPLAIFLMESAAVKPARLLEALKAQRASGRRLEEVLLERGDTTESQLAIFQAQRQQSRPAAPPRAAGAPASAAPAGNPMVKSLLGIILEREDYLNQSQVQAVVAEQERLKAQGKTGTFGELALNMGFITPEQLKFAIQLQKKLAYAPGAGKKPLGVILLENGVLKPSQIHLALQKQATTGQRLGEVLIEQGTLSENMLEIFLKMQEQG